jgi:hypothetical protein
VADEVPAESVAVARVLRGEVLRAVLADDLDARVRERLSSSTETYFVATTTVTEGPTSALIRSYRSRSSSGDTRETPWTPRGFRRGGGRRRAPGGTPCRVEALDARTPASGSAPRPHARGRGPPLHDAAPNRARNGSATSPRTS